LAAKSPFFRARFKNCCWNEKEKEKNEAIELDNISGDGFAVVVDWMYSRQLSDRVKEYSGSGLHRWAGTLYPDKAADVLVINKLKNEIIRNEAAMFSQRDLNGRFSWLQTVYDNDLCHTKYYMFVLRSAVANMMLTRGRSAEKWDEDMESV